MTMVNKPDPEPRVFSISEFRAKCLKLMDEVAATGVPVIITKRGKPIARMEPVPKSIRGFYKDKMTITGDIISPIDVEWDAMKDEPKEE